MSGIKESLHKVNRIENVYGCLVCHYDGIILDSLLPEGQNADLIAAVCSKTLQKINKALSKLPCGEMNQLSIYGDSGSQCLYHLGDKVLVVNCRKGANINYISLEIEPLIEEIRNIFNS